MTGFAMFMSPFKGQVCLLYITGWNWLKSKWALFLHLWLCDVNTVGIWYITNLEDFWAIVFELTTTTTTSSTTTTTTTTCLGPVGTQPPKSLNWPNSPIFRTNLFIGQSQDQILKGRRSSSCKLLVFIFWIPRVTHIHQKLNGTESQRAPRCKLRSSY